MVELPVVMRDRRRVVGRGMWGWHCVIALAFISRTARAVWSTAALPSFSLSALRKEQAGSTACPTGGIADI